MQQIVSAPVVRITLEPTIESGLNAICQIQIDKIMTVKREKIGQIFCHHGARESRSSRMVGNGVAETTQQRTTFNNKDYVQRRTAPKA